MNERIGEQPKVTDNLLAAQGIELTDKQGVTGIVTLQRYQGEERNPNRPLELIHLTDAMRLREHTAFTEKDGEPVAFDDRTGQQLSYRQLAAVANVPSRLAPLEELMSELNSYLAQTMVHPNLVTQTGDQVIGDNAYAIAGAPNRPTCMKLGTGNTAVAKTGAGAALVAYKTGSDKAFDATYPLSSLNGASRQEQFKTSWGAGVINGSALAEIVIAIDTLTDATSTAANTHSRALIGPYTLDVLATLAASWSILITGA